MERPFKDKRPIGPFADLGGDEVSEFDKIEVQVRGPDKDTRYEVIASHGVSPPEETVGLAVHTNAVVINGDTSFAIFDLDEPFEEITASGAEFTSSSDEKVGIKERSRELVNIIVPA